MKEGIERNNRRIRQRMLYTVQCACLHLKNYPKNNMKRMNEMKNSKNFVFKMVKKKVMYCWTDYKDENSLCENLIFSNIHGHFSLKFSFIAQTWTMFGFFLLPLSPSFSMCFYFIFLFSSFPDLFSVVDICRTVYCYSSCKLLHFAVEYVESAYTIRTTCSRRAQLASSTELLKQLSGRGSAIECGKFKFSWQIHLSSLRIIVLSIRLVRFPFRYI